MTSSADLTGEHFVAGARRRDAAVTFTGRDPRTGRELAPGYAEATPDEVAAAVEAAHAASRPLKHRDASRADLLERIAENIEALGDVLLERAALETGLGKARLEGERTRTLGQLRLFAGLVSSGEYRDERRVRADPERKPIPRPELYRVLRPVGPVAVFGASNFPLAYSVAGGDTASALGAGCPVIVKAHPNHPGTSELVASSVDRAVKELGLPAGTFSLLHGASPETALRLVRHPRVRAVGFTGSLKAGRALFDAAALRPEPIPVFAEMGSVNPVFLLPRALDERAHEIAKGLSGSFTLGAGQFCTNPGLVFLLESAANQRFYEALSEKVRATAAATLLHSGIHASYLAGTGALERLEGVELLASGSAPEGPSEGQAKVFRAPYSVFSKEPRLHEEVFGPSTVLVVCAGRAELFDAAAALDGQLTATVHATPEDAVDFAELFAILEDKAGRLVLNGYPTGVEVSAAMQHGGPYPATTDARFTAVGDSAIQRFLRPVCYQGFPESLLPKRSP